MSFQPQETLKAIAIRTVFDKLGIENFDLLRHNLRRDFDIDWETDCTFSFEEFQIALHRLIGPDAASLLVNEVRHELDLLSSP